MKITIKGRNLEITPALREYVEKRLSKFDKLLDAQEATVSLFVIKDSHRVEVTIPYNGIIIRGEEESHSMYASIDNVAEKLESQIRKYKTRLIKKGRGAAKDVVPVPVEYSDELPVKIKRFPIKPMPVEEAIMQMNLLGHSFFVFANVDNEKINVVYMRKDGAYGLLEPES